MGGAGFAITHCVGLALAMTTNVGEEVREY